MGSIPGPGRGGVRVPHLAAPLSKSCINGGGLATSRDSDVGRDAPPTPSQTQLALATGMVQIPLHSILDIRKLHLVSSSAASQLAVQSSNLPAANNALAVEASEPICFRWSLPSFMVPRSAAWRFAGASAR